MRLETCGWKDEGNKKPGNAGLVNGCNFLMQLFNLCFLVRHMLAYHRIVFTYFHFLRHVALVLGGGVVMTGTGAGDEFDFVTHNKFP